MESGHGGGVVDFSIRSAKEFTARFAGGSNHEWTRMNTNYSERRGGGASDSTVAAALRAACARLTETRLHHHGSAGTRTRNQRLKRALLYRLSYRPLFSLFIYPMLELQPTPKAFGAALPIELPTPHESSLFDACEIFQFRSCLEVSDLHFRGPTRMRQQQIQYKMTSPGT